MTYNTDNFGLNIKPIVRKTVHIRAVCPVGGRINTTYSLGIGPDEFTCGTSVFDNISAGEEKRRKRK